MVYGVGNGSRYTDDADFADTFCADWINDLVFFFDEMGENPGINRKAFGKSMAMALEVFPKS